MSGILDHSQSDVNQRFVLGGSNDQLTTEVTIESKLDEITSNLLETKMSEEYSGASGTNSNGGGSPILSKVSKTTSSSSISKVPKTKAVSKSNGQLNPIESEDDWDSAMSKDFAMIDYWATWCKPCLASIKDVKNMAFNNTNVHFFKLNVDDMQDYADDIKSLPTYQFFKNGKRVDKLTVEGASMDKVRNSLKKLEAM